MKKQIRTVKWIFGFVLMLMCMMISIPSEASTSSEKIIAEKIIKLQQKFPEGKYWNHVGGEEDPNAWTETPCYCHKSWGTDCIYGNNGCTCSHHKDSYHLLATQCMGFANKLGYDVFGDVSWEKYSYPGSAQIANIKVGDIIRINNSHSVFVIKREGNIATVGENNYYGSCRISWTRTIDLTAINITYYEHATNYDVLSDRELTEPASIDLGYTGWRWAEDKVHIQYVQNDVVLKSQWVTVNGYQYYLDADGYRVVGMYSVDGKYYFFNQYAAMISNKWFIYNNKLYYASADGSIPTNQLIPYHQGYLVYVKEDGSVARNELVKIGRNYYAFDNLGKRKAGFVKLNERYYYCTASGCIYRSKWIERNGSLYYAYANGIVCQNYAAKIGADYYYFDAGGRLVRNKYITYRGSIYKADSKGRLKYISPAR